MWKYMKIVLLITIVVGVFFVWLCSRSIGYNEVIKMPYHYDSGLNSDSERKHYGAFDAHKIVHLDLKGAPPKVEYYEYLFKLLRDLGATGVLIEYEDMFPFTGILSGVSSSDAYSISDINKINDLADKFGLSVIPLVQTFGHLEYILKLHEWSDLREVYKYPQAVCPMHNKTYVLLNEIVAQILKAHPKSEMIHIGADEVFFIGECDKCSSVIAAKHYTKNQFFLHHVGTVVRNIKNKHKNIRILMWDDEFRSTPQEDLLSWNEHAQVEPVVWKYRRNVFAEIGPEVWNTYSIVFPKLWIASAFKGATGSNKILTNIEHHIENHQSWMDVVEKYGNRVNFQGIFLTGWQRYDHFSVLCELLPAGIPSLAMCLHFLRGILQTVDTPSPNITTLLQCQNPYGLYGTNFGIPRCNFSGGVILDNIIRLEVLKESLHAMLDDSKIRGWMSSYNIEHAYTNPYYIEEALESLDRFVYELLQIKNNLMKEMSEIYDNSTVTEWIETYIKPLEIKLEELWENRRKLLNATEWSKRPLKSEL